MYKQFFADRDAVGQQVMLNGMPYTVIGRVRKKEQDSNYTGPDNNRLFVPYETMRKDFPMPGNNVTPTHVSAIIAAPYEHVADELNRIVEREGKINFEKDRPGRIGSPFDPGAARIGFDPTRSRGALDVEHGAETGLL